MTKTNSTMDDIYDLLLGKFCWGCGNSYYDLGKKYPGNACDDCLKLARKVNMANFHAREAKAKGILKVADWVEAKNLYSNSCVYCGINSLPLEIDHLWPLSLARKGLGVSEFATNTKDNIVPACRFCNLAKEDKPFIIMLGWKNGLLV